MPFCLHCYLISRRPFLQSPGMVLIGETENGSDRISPNLVPSNKGNGKRGRNLALLRVEVVSIHEDKYVSNCYQWREKQCCAELLIARKNNQNVVTAIIQLLSWHSRIFLNFKQFSPMLLKWVLCDEWCS